MSSNRDAFERSEQIILNLTNKNNDPRASAGVKERQFLDTYNIKICHGHHLETHG